jgi:hypothetical protein
MRRKWLVLPLIALAGTTALLVTSLASAVTKNFPAPQGAASQTSYLFIQNADSGSIVPKKKQDLLVLRGVDPDGLYFSDRPERIGGILTVPEMLKSLGFGNKHVATPNAVIDADTGSSRDALAVNLSHPRYDPVRHALRYRIKRLKVRDVARRTPSLARLKRFSDQLDRKLPPHFGRTSLFIDNSGWTCSMTVQNYAGAVDGDTSAGSLALQTYGAWSSDEWIRRPASIGDYTDTTTNPNWWASRAPLGHGCHNTATFVNTATGETFIFSITIDSKGNGSVSCYPGINEASTNMCQINFFSFLNTSYNTGGSGIVSSISCALAYPSACTFPDPP